MIRVLVVDDSRVSREFLQYVLGSDPEIEIAGTAANGQEALEAVERTKPHVVTMDVHMPGMDGFDATRRIMETRPTPIVIVSGTYVASETAMAFRAMEAGALAALPRPAGIGHPDHERTAADLVRTVRLMSEVKVVRRWRSRASNGLGAAGAIVQPGLVPDLAAVAIGASTGGPPALQSILSQLPADFPAPVLVVQHIAHGFAEGFAGWLANCGSLPVRLGVHGETIQPGRVYLAPDHYHMSIAGKRLVLSQEPAVNGLRPAVSHLFRSVAESFGGHAIGVLLSGMGIDGALELKTMKDRGAVTIAQDKASCVVHGMPGEAIRLGGVSYVLPPERIAAALLTISGYLDRGLQNTG